MSPLAESAREVTVDDFVGIQRLVHRYSDAASTHDPDRFAATWAEDAVWELGVGRRVEGRAAILELWRTGSEGLLSALQTVDNGDAWHTPAGATAGRWYITEMTQFADGDGGAAPVQILRGFYDDTYVRSSDGWLFASRSFGVRYFGPPDLSATFHSDAVPLGADAF